MSHLNTENSKFKPAPALGVIILGAGASSRMGRPKLLLPWQDTTVVGQIIATWRELGAAQVVVVMRPADALLAAELDRLELSVANRIENPAPERGMFSSLLCAAQWHGWQKGIARWAVALGDQPHLPSPDLRRLLALQAQNPHCFGQPAVGGRTGHPVILPSPAFDELKRTGATTFKEFLKLAAIPRVQLEMAHPGVLLDLDTPEDYIRLQPR
jgi:molybdenum cofactor cytidylyltransferase